MLEEEWIFTSTIRWADPVPFSFQKCYFDTEPVDGGFHCISQQCDFKSAVLPSKPAAENDATKHALELLQL